MFIIITLMRLIQKRERYSTLNFNNFVMLFLDVKIITEYRIGLDIVFLLNK